MEDNEIKIGFLEEGEQVIEEMETLLLDLEHAADKKETFDGIFRAVHNIKGSAKAVGFDQLGAFCHDLETYLLVYKNGEQAVTKEVINRMLQSRDVIASAFAAYKKDLNANFNFDVSFDAEESGEDESNVTDLNSAGLVVNKKTTNNNDTSVRVNLARVDKLINAVGELVVLDSVLRQQSIQSMEQVILKTVEQAGKIIREVQDLSMSLRMVPVKPLVQKLQRISRDTSSSLNKSVDFRVVGEDLEIDKTILDSISDPLVHIVRNAIDHGIENPEDRVIEGKPVAGFLELSFSQEGGKLVIRLKDDGKGLDQQRIVAKAIEKGLITSGDHLNEQQIFELIFAPGFSTKAAVTEVSGRGVGMDVVRTSVEALSGQIEISSVLHKGTDVPKAEEQTFPWKYLFDPLGVDVTFGQDNGGTFGGGSSIYIRPRDLAKIGELYLARGMWNGKRIFSEEWFNYTNSRPESFDLLDASNFSLHSKRSWWTINPKIAKAKNIPDSLIANGHWGQFLVVIPSLKMVLVRMGNDQDIKNNFDLINVIEKAVRAVEQHQGVK